jgi:hypothetical protein
MTSPSRIIERLRQRIAQPRHVATRAAFALAALGCLGCGEDEPVENAQSPKMMSWVGDVPGSDVMVSLVFGDGVGAVFFCGGDSSFRERTRWFRGKMNQAEPVAIARPDGWRVSFALADGPISGVLSSPSDEQTPFNLVPIQRGTIAGLYEARGACGLLGLIVAQPSRDATPIGQGACVGQAPLIEQVNPIAPLERTADGTILVELVGSAEQYHVAPSLPHL